MTRLSFKYIFFILLCMVFNGKAVFAQKCHCEDLVDSLTHHHYRHSNNSTDYYRDCDYCPYADSINRMFIYKRIPAFLYNESFDNWQECDHCSNSTRSEVLKRVCNLNALRYLIGLNDTGMKKLMPIPDERPNEGIITARGLVLAIPDVDKSFYDLIVRRYNELLVETKKAKRR